MTLGNMRANGVRTLAAFIFPSHIRKSCANDTDR
jgi:hypothetical protein